MGERAMTPENRARKVIDKKLLQSGWIIQDLRKLNLTAALGVVVREFPTSTGEVDYALFLDTYYTRVLSVKENDNIFAKEIYLCLRRADYDSFKNRHLTGRPGC